MDKYEFNIKVEQIKKLAAKKEFKEAAAIAKAMNWQKVKDWSTLATVINVQEAVGDYEEARDMAILAYNRNLGGRKLVYKLTELFIKVKDFDNANLLYEEYEKASMHDVNRFILYYDLRKAEGASLNELVEILEDYKEQEIDEKYMYELAKLYNKTNRREECIKTCDNLVLWFQDGIYVEKAIKLKDSMNAELTGIQKKILEDVKNKKEDVEATKEILFNQQRELAKIRKDDVDDAFLEDEGVKPETETAVVAPKKEAEDDGVLSMELVQNNQDSRLGEYIKNAITNPVGKGDEAAMESAPEADVQEAEEIKEFKKAEDKSEVSDDTDADNDTNDTFEVDYAAVDEDTESADDKAAFLDNGKPQLEVSEEGKAAASQGRERASLSLKELIENAKKKIENSYEQINKEDEEERRKEAEARIDAEAEKLTEELSIPEYSSNPYDTQNLQAELASIMSDVFEEDAQENVFKPESSVKNKEAHTLVMPSEIRTEAEDDKAESDEDEQIEGQLSIMDWMESVKEEKYGKQDTKEFSKAELERMLDEKDEKSAAYEKLIEQQRMAAKANGQDFDKEEAERKAREQMMLNAVKTDLAIRTGKATLRLEEAAAELKKDDNKAAKTETMAADTVSDVQSEIAATTVAEDVNEEKIDSVPLVTTDIPAISEALLSRAGDIMEEDKAMEESAISEELIDDDNEEMSDLGDVTVGSETRKIDSSTVKEDKFKDSEETDNAGHGRKLTGELAKIFRKYREMPGLEDQLVELFETIDDEMNMSTSKSGNILITGNSSSDKIDLARTIIRAINQIYPENQKKIAKTTGESINQRGIVKAMSKLKGTALIVEGAGIIQPKRINEIINCLEQDTDRMIVIFEDSDAEMNVLLNFNPELTNVFNHRIVLKQYTVNELVEMAKRFARKRQYEVDDSALLELYLKIDKLHGTNDNIKLDDIKEIINQAIVNSEKRASRRFFGGLRRKHGENGEVTFLTEADFKD